MLDTASYPSAPQHHQVELPQARSVIEKTLPQPSDVRTLILSSPKPRQPGALYEELLPGCANRAVEKIVCLGGKGRLP
jgi:hypothetical protein